MIPQDCLYTEEHEWVRAEGESAVMGITAHAAEQLGDVTFIDLPSPGEVCRRGESLGSVESVKAVSDVYAPVGGKVSEVNDRLESDPGLINSDPYGEGWICKLELADRDELGKLLDAAGYRALIQQ